MKVITAPEYYALRNDDVAVFLAGGITNCEDWQNKVIDCLKRYTSNITDKLVIFNPRRSEWPSNGDLEEVRRQIHWEADYICKCNIFSMYFTNTKDSDQPICFYELGRYTQGRDIISYQEGFRRALDVDIQMEILCPGIKVNKNITPEQHAELIFKKYKEWVEPYNDEDGSGYHNSRNAAYRRGYRR